ncbi:MAG: DUF2061 domain-containing protein [Lentisphaerales bacterium]|jgi:uncharacterized membrane protein|nr:MAG: DUF2061 domain-containing protein [Lentisphaerales bacterium]
METHRRSIMKSISWRLVATVCTSFAGWFITGSLQAGISIGIVDCLIKIGIYYGHERAWQRVSWGLVRVDRVQTGEGI